jgi:hypothetical protein
MEVHMHAEIEVKYPLLKKDISWVQTLLTVLGFKALGSKTLHDYFLKVEKDERGWNFTRLRNDGKYYLTVKDWLVDSQGNRVRREDEREVFQTEFDSLRAQALFGYQKERSDFKGHILGHPATISLDAVRVGKKTYYFLEAEVNGSVDNSESLRQQLTDWMEDWFSVETEAPSMMDFLVEHGLTNQCEKSFSSLEAK